MSKEYGGLSFIVRVHNEAERLREALASLQDVTLNHEIVVICHLCTDGSMEVAERALANGQPIRIFVYTAPISRPGYETMVTPIDHPGSYIRYVNWCFEKARFAWTFKWDADFVASTGLLFFLNEKLDVSISSSLNYNIGVQLGPAVVHAEVYLTNCLVGFVKCIFWELQEFKPDAKTETLGVLISSMSPSIIKDYWRSAPWFTNPDTVDDELCRKFRILTDICGKEAVALARGSNPDFKIDSVQHQQHALTAHGIHFYEGWAGPHPQVV